MLLVLVLCVFLLACRPVAEGHVGVEELSVVLVCTAKQRELVTLACRFALHKEVQQKVLQLMTEYAATPPVTLSPGRLRKDWGRSTY